MRQKVVYFLSILVTYLVLSMLVGGILSFVFMLFSVSPYMYLVINLVFLLVINPLVTFVIGQLLIRHKFI